MRQLLNDRDEYSLEFGADFELEYHDHRRKGLPDATSQTFADFAEKLVTLAAPCTGSRHIAAAIIVTAISDAIHELGSEVHTEVRAQLRAKSVAADNLPLTIDVAKLTLTKLERKADRNRRNGAAKRAATDRRSSSPRPSRDPRKTDAGSDGASKKKTAYDERSKAWLTRPWVDSDSPCPHKDCKGPHCGKSIPPSIRQVNPDPGCGQAVERRDKLGAHEVPSTLKKAYLKGLSSRDEAPLRIRAFGLWLAASGVAGSVSSFV